MNTPINGKVVSQKISESGLGNIGDATIRELVKLVNQIEEVYEKDF